MPIFLLLCHLRPKTRMRSAGKEVFDDRAGKLCHSGHQVTGPKRSIRIRAKLLKSKLVKVRKGQKQDSRVYYGWFLIGGLFVIAFLSPMGRYILTVLSPFIMKDPGWSRQTIGMAFTLHFWAYAFLAFFAGRLVDEIGGRITIFVGGALMLVGLILLAKVQQLWQFYLVFGVLLAAAISMSHFVPNTALVRKWFVKKAGFATGLVTVGTVTGLAVLPPVISQLSAHLGWRTVCVLCAIVIGPIIMLTTILIIRNTPESMGLSPDGENASSYEDNKATLSNSSDLSENPLELTTSEVLRTKNFWFLFVAYSVTGIAVQGLLCHVIIWGVDLGLSPANSGMIMAAICVPSIPLRILAGWMGDRLGKKKILIFFNLYSVVMWSLGCFFIKDSQTFLIFMILIGLGYSAPFSLYTPFVGDVFGAMVVGTLIGILTFGHGIIGGLGPYGWGWIADKTGSYSWNCLISAFCYAIAVVSIFLIKPSAHGQQF